ncbi:MAG: hypothetical protein KF859_00030 [Phycisphaeraceae bacterium]|nr:hypothetical protein [Phycisphaeraceae bacterium]
MDNRITDSSTESAEHASARIRLLIWAVIAAFGTYFCMYAFRKPFTAASYAGQGDVWGMDFKTVLVSAQVAGYTISKFLGIKVIAEMTPSRRAAAILVLIGIAQAGLIAFGLLPRPWNVLAIFINGLPLGMVFGLVLGFLEGRRLTEVMTAGLCASFILADGVVKSVGAWLLSIGVPEPWMPSAAGMLFVPAILVGVWMLSRLPAPDAADIAARAERTTLNRRERLSLLGRYALGMLLLVVLYLVLTIVRSVRADFAPEIWRGMGVEAAPSVFSQTESIVALVVLLVSGAMVLISDNRRAFNASMGVCALGGIVIATSLIGHGAGVIGAFGLMTLAGLGMYLPYAAMNTVVFERLLAMTRERGNMGFLMYVVDSVGYLGYVGVIIFKGSLESRGNMFGLFTTTCWIAASLCVVCGFGSWIYFAGKGVRGASVAAGPEAIVPAGVNQ